MDLPIVAAGLILVWLGTAENMKAIPAPRAAIRDQTTFTIGLILALVTLGLCAGSGA